MKEGQVIRTTQNNGHTVTFRYPRWQDVPAYVEMCNILHQERVMAYHAETSFAKGCDRLSGILVDLETGKRSHLLIEVDGQIVGEGSLQLDTAHRMGTLGIKIIGRMGTLGIKIIGRCRRRGLGREMMLLLEAEGRKFGLRRIYLHVWHLNEAAISLYQKIGYQEVGRVPEWYSMKDEDGNLVYSDLIEMIKDIGG